MSPPSRGAWIEINVFCTGDLLKMSPPSRGAWIEMTLILTILFTSKSSPPSRGAWIEIELKKTRNGERKVAPLAGGVD